MVCHPSLLIALEFFEVLGHDEFLVLWLFVVEQDAAVDGLLGHGFKGKGLIKRALADGPRPVALDVLTFPLH